MPAIISKAPGKTILFGEHAVVYGYPAIAVPVETIHVKVTILPIIQGTMSKIKLRNSRWVEDILFENLSENDPIRVTIENVIAFSGTKQPFFEMVISSTIPIAAGLGSSAALAIAIIRGFSHFLGIRLSTEDINTIAFESEKIQHGSPSGIDNNVITYRQSIFFRRNTPIKKIRLGNPLHIILGDTGERTLTKDVVNLVRQDFERSPKTVRPILERIGKITEAALDALTKGDVNKVGDLMSKNHAALKELNVSSANLDRLVESAVDNGAFGAKLCGSGQGGYMVALCSPQMIEKISAGLIDSGATNLISTTITGKPSGI